MTSWKPFVEACLVRRRRSPADAPALSDVDVDWLATIARANDDFVVPALWTAFGELDLRDRLPKDVEAYLHHLFESNAQCNEQLRGQCLSIGRMLTGARVEAVLLKGAAWLFEEGGARHDRMMRDIDLLVAASDEAVVIETLARFGYRPADGIVAEPGHIHRAPLIREGEPANVEIHVEPTTRVRMLSGAEVIAGSSPVAPGLRMPSHRHRLVHNVIHAQIVNGDYHGGVIGPRYCLDTARLIEAGGGSIDWNALARDARERGYWHEMSAALHKAARFAGARLYPPFADDRSGRRHAARCAMQSQRPVLDAALRKWGLLRRALAWDRDSYALDLGDDRGLSAHIAVARRRLGRTAMAMRRRLSS